LFGDFGCCCFFLGRFTLGLGQRQPELLRLAFWLPPLQLLLPLRLVVTMPLPPLPLLPLLLDFPPRYTMMGGPVHC
jgi:hypothetical protein